MILLADKISKQILKSFYQENHVLFLNIYLKVGLDFVPSFKNCIPENYFNNFDFISIITDFVITQQLLTILKINLLQI